MLPLNRLLFALTALFAAASSQQYDCRTVIIGTVTSITQPFGPIPMPSGGSGLDTSLLCQSPFSVVGEKITVCNNTPGNPPPDVDTSKLYPVNMLCHDLSGCTAQGEVYCG